MREDNDIAIWLKETIARFVRESPENSMGNESQERAWDEPLVGFSRGGDPLYREFKKHIGSFYWTPLDAFLQAFPETAARSAELAVIGWILPQTEATKAAQRREDRYPSEAWVRSYVYGEEFNVRLRKHVVAALEQAGIQAVAPMLAPSWRREISPRYGFASTWSERHAAYAAGLGTFGLCDGLITPRGKAMRCGSVVARLAISPTPRPYDDRHAYCLFFSEATCGLCIGRCPAGAISEAGHDKEKCKDYTRGEVLEHVKTRYSLDAYPCGLCQAGVPCESRIPTLDDLR
jgi:epoxyqueuosine reductase QueG